MLATLRSWLIIAPSIAVTTAICGTLSWLFALLDSSGRKPHRIAQFWARLLLRIGGVRVRVEGLEHLEAGGAYVFASNHLSLMDTPLVLANIPVQFRFLAKRSLYKVPFIGSHLRRAGHIPVERENPRASLRTLAEAARIVRERGVSVLVFPEGSRSRGQLGRFKEGAAYIAIKAGVPLVPLGIQGTHKILPAGSLTVRPGPAILRVGHPIPTTHLSAHEHRRLTALVRERVAELIGAAPSRATA